MASVVVEVFDVLKFLTAELIILLIEVFLLAELGLL
jgi:hypothetical protein